MRSFKITHGLICIGGNNLLVTLSRVFRPETYVDDEDEGQEKFGIFIPTETVKVPCCIGVGITNVFDLLLKVSGEFLVNTENWTIEQCQISCEIQGVDCGEETDLDLLGYAASHAEGLKDLWNSKEAYPNGPPFSFIISGKNGVKNETVQSK